MNVRISAPYLRVFDSVASTIAHLLTFLAFLAVCVFAQWWWHVMTPVAVGCPLEVAASVMWWYVKGGVMTAGGGENTSYVENGCEIEQWVCACVFWLSLVSCCSSTQPKYCRFMLCRVWGKDTSRDLGTNFSRCCHCHLCLQPVLECAVERGLVYNKVNPIFHHWRVEDRKFGLTFQSPADAISFEKGLQLVIDKLNRGRDTHVTHKNFHHVAFELAKPKSSLLMWSRVWLALVLHTGRGRHWRRWTSCEYLSGLSVEHRFSGNVYWLDDMWPLPVSYRKWVVV